MFVDGRGQTAVIERPLLWQEIKINNCRISKQVKMSSRFGGAVQPPSSTNPRGVNAMGPRNTQKTKGTAVISIDELDRIRRQVVETKADSYETIRNNQRAALQQTSKSRVQNWSNTMDAQRIKREEDRIKRLEDAEVSGGDVRWRGGSADACEFGRADRAAAAGRGGAGVPGRAAAAAD